MSNVKKGNKTVIEIGASDLRMLVHWASVGVRDSKYGSYQAHIERVISEQAKRVNFNTGGEVKFGEWL